MSGVPVLSYQQGENMDTSDKARTYAARGREFLHPELFGRLLAVYGVIRAEALTRVLEKVTVGDRSKAIAILCRWGIR